MNNIFNTKRFGRLFIKQLAEHYKTYLMALSVLVGVMLVGGSFFVYIIPAPLDISTQVILFAGPPDVFDLDFGRAGAQADKKQILIGIYVKMQM